MADRFPSIEDIDDGKAPPAGDGSMDLMDGGDDNSDFLTRERAALGADAEQFSTAQDNAGPTVSVQDGDDDLLGGSGNAANGSSMDDVNQFQSSFPPVNTQNERVGPGGTITGTSPRPTSPYPTTSYETEEEPAVIREWRERRDMAVQSREEKSAARKSETVKAAQEAIDEFYENYNNKKEKGLGQTKKEAEDFMQKRENTSSGGTSWERIAKLVDVKGGGKAGAGAEGKEKFRDLLAGLMKDENAPGAKGY